MRHTEPRSAQPVCRSPTSVPLASPHRMAKALSFFSLRTENETAKRRQHPPLAAPSVPLPARRPTSGTAAQRCQRRRPGKDALPAAPARRRELPRAAPSPGARQQRPGGNGAQTEPGEKWSLGTNGAYPSSGAVPAVGRGRAARPGCRCGLRGAPAAGRKATLRPARRCPPGPADRGAALTCGGAGAGWAAAASLCRGPGWGLRCGHRSPAGRSCGGPGPGSWQRRGPCGEAAAAGGRSGSPSGRREGGTVAEDRPRRRPLSPRRSPPNPPPPGWRRRDRSPAAVPAPRKGAATGRGRPAPRGAAVALKGPRGRSRQRPGKGPPPPAPPGRRARPTPSSVGRTCRETSGPAAGHRVFTCASFGRASQMTRGAKVALLVADSGNVPSRASCFLRKVSASAALRTTRRSLPCLRRDAGTAGLLSKFTFMRGKERRWAGRSLSPYLAEPLKWVQKATTCDGKT